MTQQTDEEWDKLVYLELNSAISAGRKFANPFEITGYLKERRHLNSDIVDDLTARQLQKYFDYFKAHCNTTAQAPDSAATSSSGHSLSTTVTCVDRSKEHQPFRAGVVLREKEKEPTDTIYCILDPSGPSRVDEETANRSTWEQKDGMIKIHWMIPPRYGENKSNRYGHTWCEVCQLTGKNLILGKDYDNPDMDNAEYNMGISDKEDDHEMSVVMQHSAASNIASDSSTPSHKRLRDEKEAFLARMLIQVTNAEFGVETPEGGLDSKRRKLNR